MEYSNNCPSEPQPRGVMAKYKVLAQKLYEHEVSLFKNKTSNLKGGFSTWVKAINRVTGNSRYKKVEVVKEKQKHNADEDSIEGVDDEEFEKLIDTFDGDNCFMPGKDDIDFASNMK
ncbi:hypothetical protein ACRRTK_007404 [Alexandromys fortis]